MVHFATHGVLAGELEGTHEPGLILTPPEHGDRGGRRLPVGVGDRRPQARRGLGDPVGLQHGGRRGNQRRGALGPGAGLHLRAGRALLVSHWEVYSDATVKLITAAVGEMARDPKVGRAEALRRSMLALIDKGAPHEAHPAYWAPFVVVGEGGLAR